MNKEQKSVVQEYVSSLSDAMLQFHATRLTEKLAGDLAESLDRMSQDRRIDGILASAECYDDFYYYLDQIKDLIIKECKKKNIYLNMSNAAS